VPLHALTFIKANTSTTMDKNQAHARKPEVAPVFKTRV
jgi:hypothetical protein